MIKTEHRILNKAGIRVTNQRTLIMDIIKEGHGHLDADEIYLRARKKEPRLSLSTVYRTLHVLKKLDLVDELHFDETHHRYEAKPSLEHHHLVCLGCGKIIEFECPMSQQMKDEVSREKGFEVINTEVQMTGYCSECQKR